MKSAKFIIAENPIVNDGRVFIIHLRDPVIIAEAFHFDLDQESEWMECKSNFQIGASIDYAGELITLGARFVGPVPDKWFAFSTQEQADKLAKIMRRIGDWYHHYINWRKNLK